MRQTCDPPPRPDRRKLLQSAVAGGPGATGAPAVDVVVIGAGLSGLTAARELRRRGYSVAVLEARDRVGGRTWTVPVGSRRYDIGGQFVGPSQDRVRALVAEFGLRLQTVYSEARHIWELPGQRLEFSGNDPSLSLLAKFDLGHILGRMNRLAQSVGTQAPWDAPDAAALDALTLAQWTRQHGYSESTAQLVTVMTRAVLGVDPDEISALYWAYYVAQGDSIEMLIGGAGGAQDSVIEGGSQQLSLRLAQQLGDAVQLGTPVRRVVHGPGGVQVQADRGIWQGRYAVVALPPSVACAIAFEPTLAGDRRELQLRAPMGRYAKVVISYGQAFWREHGYAGDAASLRGPVSASYDDSSAEGPALLGFIGGDAERAWRMLPAEARKAAVLDCFARWFGPAALKPSAYAEYDWTLDDWTAGAPATALAPGVLSRLGPALRRPVGRIHWAGTETALRWTGYMDGAIRAGEAAAGEVAARLSAEVR
jgi:monoamine oxidase